MSPTDSIARLSTKELDDIVTRIAREESRRIISTPMLREAAVPGSLPRRTLDVIPVVTALPRDPTEGDEVYVTPAAGVLWNFVYLPSALSSYPWLFKGGAEVTINTPGGLQFNTTSYADPSVGSSPSFTPPFAGDYFISWQGFGHCTGGGANVGHVIPYQAGGPALVDTSAAYLSATATYLRNGRAGRHDGYLGGVPITLRGKATAGIAVFDDNDFSIRPVRVGT